MNDSKWGQYFQVSTNVAVLLGVILVVVQLRQNADLLELQILKQDADNYTASALDLLPENIDEIMFKALETPQDLTGAEIISLDKYFWSRQVMRWRGLYDLAERGLLEDTAWKRAIREEATVLNHPFGHAWWKGIKNWETTLPDEFMKLVDEEIVNPANEPQRVYYENLRRRVLTELEQSQK